MALNLNHKRQGQMDYEQIYFFTQTILGHKRLLDYDQLKMIIIDSLKFLVNNSYVNLYGYVIMPNHIHFIWKMMQKSGNESPAASFSKFTAHQFKKWIKTQSSEKLNKYLSKQNDRSFQFWKDDPLAIPLSTEEILIQKLDYIHHNPLQEKWKLSNLPEDYKWSSANFYLSGIDEFGILKHFRD